MKKLFLLYILLLFFILSSNANNLKISDVNVIGNQITFKLSWENSWNDEENWAKNHDAAWIFIKYKQENQYWKTLNINALSFLSKNNVFRAENPQNEAGLMIYPANFGDFSSIYDEISLQAEIPEGNIELKIMGIEMVFVPQYSFYLGDCVSFHSFCKLSDSSSFFINSEKSLKLSAIEDSTLTSQLPENYPKGFASFYAMKYEISQEQYVDFLNCLTANQQKQHSRNNIENDGGSLAFASNSESRNSLIISVPSVNQKPAIFACNANHNNVYNEETDAQTRAMSWLNWTDITAYLDWSGLRPLSELEFEKLSRGNLPVVKGEFVWGTPYVLDANTLENDGTSFEKVSEIGNDTIGLANHGYDGLQGALRCGFAASDSSNRAQSGSSFYGAKELSGNVWEAFVSATNIAFTNENGDGKIDEDGFSDINYWNPISADGTILRGGAWGSGIYEVGNWRDLAVSDRYYFYLKADTRRNTTGGRGGISFK